MGFYDYFYGQHNKTSSLAVAQDAADETSKENLVTIRRVFKISSDKMKELGREDKGEEEKKDDADGEVKAQDEAIAEDALSKRHSSTPLEDCKAKDPRYCPYHGAMQMTKDFDEMFKNAGIYAQGGVERIKQGKYKVQYSVPPSKKDAANKLISEYLNKPGFQEVEDTDGDDVDDIAKTVKMDKKDDQFAMREEHLERLEADMKKGAKVDPSALYQLRKDHHDLKALGEAAWKARTDAGLAEESSLSNAFKDWAATNPEWKKYREAQAKFDKDYNYLRGNADLAHIEKQEDVIELMDHLNGQIDKIGTFMKAKAGIDALKKSMGITKMPPGLEATAKYNKAMGETSMLARELSDAHKHCVEANESNDIGQQRAAAHELEIVLRNLEENKDIINDAFKAAQEFETYLKGHTAESLKAASKEAMAKKKAEKAAAEKAAAEAEAAKGGSGEEVPSGEMPKTEEKPKEETDKSSEVSPKKDVGEEKKSEEKPHESSGGEGEKKSYTEEELKGKFEPIQDELKKLYKDAGYEKAIDLQKQYEDATGKSIFDNEELGAAAANCFHSGTWQVWNDDGVSDMVDIYQSFDEVKTPEGLIESYKGLTKNIKEFVEKAEKYLSEKGIGKGGSESAKSEKPTKEDKPLSFEEDKYAVYSDVMKKFNEKYGTKFEKYDEIKSLLESAQKGTFDLTPAGGGKYSNDMQFLEDIKAAVGKDHPYIKAIEGYIEKMKSGKSGSTESSSTSEKKPTDVDDRTSAKEAWKKAAKAKDDFWDRMMSKATEKTTKGAIAAMTPEDRAERDRVEKAEAEAYSAYKGSGKHDSDKSAASKYIDSIKADKAAHYKDKFIKKFGEDMYGQVLTAAEKAKSEGRSLNGISRPSSGIDAKSLSSLVKKMGGTAKIMESGSVEFSIDPAKAHELYAKMDARGGEVLYDAD